MSLKKSPCDAVEHRWRGADLQYGGGRNERVVGSEYVTGFSSVCRGQGERERVA